MYNNFTYPLPSTPHTKFLLDVLRPQSEALYSVDIKVLPFSAFRIYNETGSRVEYEQAYMEHRKMLCAFAGMALVETDGKWLEKLIDVIWAICDEFTWALPAHIADITNSSDTASKIDLFSSETAMALAEIDSIFGDLLPRAVRNRIRYEEGRRIVRPYLGKDRNSYGINNWAAVCSCGVGTVMILLGMNEEFEEARENLLCNIDEFLSSYNDDGCCMEGPLYWSYGFSFFCYFAELLRQYTNGKVDFFQNEKVRKIAYFGQNTRLLGNDVIPFSDSAHQLGYDFGLWSLLASKYDGIIVPDAKYQNRFGDDVRYRFAPFIRNLFWDFGKANDTSSVVSYVYYPDAQWYINKKHSYFFAAKGGTNDEPHNHNDIGSFLLYDDGKYILDDPGWAQYDKDYFAPKKRYLNMCASSRGHSVPIFGGKEQEPGKDRKASVIDASETRFAFEFSSAYDSDVLSLKRQFTLENNGIHMFDVIRGTAQNVTERFVTGIKPEIVGKTVRIANYRLSCDKEADIQLSSFEFIPRFCGLDGSENLKVTAYLIDFSFTVFSEAEFHISKA